MKKLKDLSKTELLSFIYNHMKDINIHDDLAECASCGTTAEAPYYYICDKCNKMLSN